MSRQTPAASFLTWARRLSASASFSLLCLLLSWQTLVAETPVQTQPEPEGEPALTAVASERAENPKFHNETIRGRVVWFAKTLKSEFGISTVPEVAEHTLAIWTKEKKLIPVVENLRGRAFRKDPRLREMELEFLARRHDAQPMIQIMRVFEIKGNQRFEVDYWCDVCAIVMYETGPCSCCQDNNRLRKRLVEKVLPARKTGELTTKPKK